MLHRMASTISIGVFCVASLFGQGRYVMRGRVLDRETGEAISSVNVIIRGEKRGTVTDTAGYFRLALPTPEKRIVVFSHITYKKETRSISFDTTSEVTLRIYLVPDTIRIHEVLVEGERQIVPSETDRKMALYTLNGDDFERLGEDDMERAMRYLLPQIIRRPELRMRSDTADFTLYVNGVWKESIYLDQINPYEVRRVTVWGPLGHFKDMDFTPLGFPLLRGRFVVLVETKSK